MHISMIFDLAPDQGLPCTINWAPVYTRKDLSKERLVCLMLRHFATAVNELDITDTMLEK